MNIKMTDELIQFSRSHVGTLGQTESKCITDSINIELPSHYTRCVLSANEIKDLYNQFYNFKIQFYII